MSIYEQLNNSPVFTYKNLTTEILESAIKKAFSKTLSNGNSYRIYCNDKMYNLIILADFMFTCSIDYHVDIPKRSKFTYYVSLFRKSGLYKMSIGADKIEIYKGTQRIYFTDTYGDSLRKKLNQLKNESI